MKTTFIKVLLVFSVATSVRGSCSSDTDCSGGTCYPTYITDGLCVCAEGEGGVDCSLACTGCTFAEKKICLTPPAKARTTGKCEACPACATGATCIENPAGTAACMCPSTHVGALCDKACPADADCDNGDCALDGDVAICQCDSGWIGTKCDIECPAAAECVNGDCTLDGSDAKCKCDSGWMGTKCDIACPAATDCVNGACVLDGDAAKCQCESGWIGTKCDLKCPACQNGGTCEENPAGEAMCRCPDTHAGDLCQYECTPPCTADEQICTDAGDGSAECTDCPDCKNQGTCQASGEVATCKCPNTHIGDTCQLICPSCLNGGTCQEDPAGTASCSCSPNYAGNTCQLECDPVCGSGTSCIEAEDGTAQCSLATGLAVNAWFVLLSVIMTLDN